MTESEQLVGGPTAGGTSTATPDELVSEELRLLHLFADVLGHPTNGSGRTYLKIKGELTPAAADRGLACCAR